MQRQIFFSSKFGYNLCQNARAFLSKYNGSLVDPHFLLNQFLLNPVEFIGLLFSKFTSVKNDPTFCLQHANHLHRRHPLRAHANQPRVRRVQDRPRINIAMATICMAFYISNECLVHNPQLLANNGKRESPNLPTQIGVCFYVLRPITTNRSCHGGYVSVDEDLVGR